jgi:hypothetical protein
MQDINIDDFYKDMATTLLSLYQQFPRKISLYIEDICGPDEVDEFGLHSKRYLSCIGAIMWLMDEGYIRYTDIAHQESVEDCTLTQKSFSKLIKPSLIETSGAESNSIEKQRSTLAHQMYAAIQAHSSIAIKELIETHIMV